jgi:adenylate cyclase
LLLSLRGAYGARLVSLGRVRESLDLSAENIRDADEIDEPDLRAQARLGAAYGNLIMGNLARAREFIEEGTELTGGDLQMGRDLTGFSFLIWFELIAGEIAGMQGRLEESAQRLEGAFRLAREAGESENLGWLSSGVVHHAVNTGQIVFEELGDARTAALEALRIALEMGSAFSQAVAQRSLGEVRLVDGQPKEALAALELALGLLRDRQTGLESESMTLINLSTAHLELGDARQARRVAEEAIAAAMERGLRVSEMFAQIAFASSLAAQAGSNTRRDAGKALARASALMEETGALVAEPQIEEAHGRVALACGDPDASRSHLREAQRLYTEIGATGHSQRLADELGAA